MFSVLSIKFLCQPKIAKKEKILITKKNQGNDRYIILRGRRHIYIGNVLNCNEIRYSFSLPCFITCIYYQHAFQLLSQINKTFLQ